MQNYMLALCYDGSRYRGWQRQGNTPDTIQAKVEGILGRILEQPVEVAASGRTDAGVHARRQVCSFRADTALPSREILARLREHLPEDIGALSLDLAPPRFHARLSCLRKTYLYRIWNSDAPNVFLRRYMLAVPEVLDLAAMAEAAALMEGEHDLIGFSSLKSSKKSTVRRIDQVSVEEAGDELTLRFTGSGFLYNSIRIMAGTLLEVGKGQLRPQIVEQVYASCDRALAGPTLPAHGLILWDAEHRIDLS